MQVPQTQGIHWSHWQFMISCSVSYWAHTSPLRRQWFPNVLVGGVLRYHLKGGLRWWFHAILYVCRSQVGIWLSQSVGTQAKNAEQSHALHTRTLRQHWHPVSISRSSNCMYRNADEQGLFAVICDRSNSVFHFGFITFIEKLSDKEPSSFWTSLSVTNYGNKYDSNMKLCSNYILWFDYVLTLHFILRNSYYWRWLASTSSVRLLQGNFEPRRFRLGECAFP